MKRRRCERVRAIRPLFLIVLAFLVAPLLNPGSLSVAPARAAQGGDAANMPLTLPLRGDVPLTLPMRGDVQIIGFAPGEFDHQNEDHWAVDLWSSQLDVFATAPGWVLFAGENCDSDVDWCYGQTVLIDHGGGLYSIYTHLREGSLVAKDSFVNSTTVIGEMSNTGCPDPADPTTCTVHLHFAVRTGPPNAEELVDLLFDGRYESYPIYGVIPGLPDEFQKTTIPGVGSSPIPGGMWETIEIDGDVLRLAARAYPNSSSDYGIAYVNFTLSWPGRSGPWLLACPPIAAPASGDRYECTANLRQLGVPTGDLQMSFDVYDLAGNSNLAPHGVQSVRWP